MTDAHGAVAGADEVKKQWLDRLSALIDQVEQWARELGWATRRIKVTLKAAETGAYEAPALLLQENAVRLLLEPIAHAAPGADGVVDLYVMPAYDDVATLFHYDGAWHLHQMMSPAPAGVAGQDVESTPLSKQALHETLERMLRHAE